MNILIDLDASLRYLPKKALPAYRWLDALMVKAYQVDADGFVYVLVQNGTYMPVDVRAEGSLHTLVGGQARIFRFPLVEEPAPKKGQRRGRRHRTRVPA